MKYLIIILLITSCGKKKKYNEPTYQKIEKAETFFDNNDKMILKLPSIGLTLKSNELKAVNKSTNKTNFKMNDQILYHENHFIRETILQSLYSNKDIKIPWEYYSSFPIFKWKNILRLQKLFLNNDGNITRSFLTHLKFAYSFNPIFTDQNQKITNLSSYTSINNEKKNFLYLSRNQNHGNETIYSNSEFITKTHLSPTILVDSNEFLKGIIRNKNIHQFIKDFNFTYDGKIYSVSNLLPKLKKLYYRLIISTNESTKIFYIKKNTPLNKSIKLILKEKIYINSDGEIEDNSDTTWKTLNLNASSLLQTPSPGRTIFLINFSKKELLDSATSSEHFIKKSLIRNRAKKNERLEFSINKNYYDGVKIYLNKKQILTKTKKILTKKKYDYKGRRKHFKAYTGYRWGRDLKPTNKIIHSSNKNHRLNDLNQFEINYDGRWSSLSRLHSENFQYEVLDNNSIEIIFTVPSEVIKIRLKRYQGKRTYQEGGYLGSVNKSSKPKRRERNKIRKRYKKIKHAAEKEYQIDLWYQKFRY